MKVLLINGSPHLKGTTYEALSEAARALNSEGIETEIVNVGSLKISGCTSCNGCKKTGRCTIDDEVNELAKSFEEADGLIIGSPVYFSSPNGTLISFLDRLFRSVGFDKTMKVGAAVVCARRGGCTSTFDVINKYFSISGMPIAPSTYWNQVYGAVAEDALEDREGMQTMRNLAYNMAFMIKSIALGKERYGMPKKDSGERTSFIQRK